ncbi:MAG: type I-B CRISPR-associated protein Cas5 [Bacteroidia bacterium]|nr:type I-B CRISPR-associated protein Cas5 [Bacteroidia bacterium]
MKVFCIDICSWTASFRYPNLISGVQPTLDVPPISTVLGLINAAAGSYQNYEKLTIGYYFEFQGKTTDLETIYMIDSTKDGRPTNHAKSNVIRRDILFDAFLRLYVPDEQIAAYFQNPYYPLVLGRMNDLASVDVKNIRQVSLEKVENAENIRGQVIPFFPHRLPGVIQALPKYFSDTIPRQNLGTEAYSVIDYKSRTQSALTAYRDVTLTKGVDIYFHELDFTEFTR